MNMQNEGETVHLIPISITKDRLLDMSNLASEMVSDGNPKISLIKLDQNLRKNNGVGRIFLHFGETINLKHYFN